MLKFKDALEKMNDEPYVRLERIKAGLMEFGCIELKNGLHLVSEGKGDFGSSLPFDLSHEMLNEPVLSNSDYKVLREKIIDMIDNWDPDEENKSADIIPTNPIQRIDKICYELKEKFPKINILYGYSESVKLWYLFHTEKDDSTLIDNICYRDENYFDELAIRACACVGEGLNEFADSYHPPYLNLTRYKSEDKMDTQAVDSNEERPSTTRFNIDDHPALVDPIEKIQEICYQIVEQFPDIVLNYSKRNYSDTYCIGFLSKSIKPERADTFFIYVDSEMFDGKFINATLCVLEFIEITDLDQRIGGTFYNYSPNHKPKDKE